MEAPEKCRCMSTLRSIALKSSTINRSTDEETERKRTSCNMFFQYDRRNRQSNKGDCFEKSQSGHGNLDPLSRASWWMRVAQFKLYFGGLQCVFRADCQGHGFRRSRHFAPRSAKRSHTEGQSGTPLKMFKRETDGCSDTAQHEGLFGTHTNL